jgi:DNA-binding MarR family transcriptional regulator
MGVKKSESRGSLSKAEYEMLAAFRYTLRSFLGFSQTAAASVGLTPQQHQALLAIKGFPGRDYVTNGELAEQLQIKHHSAVGLLNRLEAQGLLAREQGHSDKRKVYVTLTPRGTRLLEKLTAAHQDELRQIASQLRSILERLG